VEGGEGDVNEAPITGESLPVSKAPGTALYAGSINGNATLVGMSTHLASDTVLARIIRMVGEAQNRRAPAEQWVDGFARIYTPVVMVLALLVVLLPPLMGLGTWSTWFYRALVLLVIACPCGLVLSTRVSLVSGLPSAGRPGIPLEGGRFVGACLLMHVNLVGWLCVFLCIPTLAGQPCAGADPPVLPQRTECGGGALRPAGAAGKLQPDCALLHDAQGGRAGLCRLLLTASRKVMLPVSSSACYDPVR